MPAAKTRILDKTATNLDELTDILTDIYNDLAQPDLQWDVRIQVLEDESGYRTILLEQ